MMFNKFSQLSPVVKVAVTWAGWATICLSGYYYARIWAADQRVESLKIRKIINSEFNAKLTEARGAVERKNCSK